MVGGWPLRLQPASASSPEHSQCWCPAQLKLQKTLAPDSTWLQVHEPSQARVTQAHSIHNMWEAIINYCFMSPHCGAVCYTIIDHWIRENGFLMEWQLSSGGYTGLQSPLPLSPSHLWNSFLNHSMPLLVDWMFHIHECRSVVVEGEGRLTRHIWAYILTLCKLLHIFLL